ncbi:MAG: phosphate signaling complex protein PhoU, partial [Dehalococcoidia bacterium]
MLRLDLDRQLGQLQQEVVSLAEIVDKATMRAVDALKRRDLVESQQVVQEDDYIDQKRYEIEDRCIDLIATQQPMARDLRAIIALLHITSELERMGDYAEGISKISLLMGEEAPLKPLIDIPRMADKATLMLRNSIDSLVSRDVVKANQVLQDDDEVDDLYDQVYRELLVFMLQDPQTIQRATYLLWAAHDLERIADRATNIA